MSTAARDGNPLDDQQRREARRQFFREFWPKQRRRGNAFRDSLYESIKARGLTEAKGWTTEKKSPIKGNDRPDRFLDIFNERLHVGVETKLGGGERERVLDQIRNDLDAVRAGHERFWVHNDLSRLKDNRVLRGLRAMEKRYPEKFALVDASDPASRRSDSDSRATRPSPTRSRKPEPCSTTTTRNTTRAQSTAGSTASATPDRNGCRPDNSSSARRSGCDQRLMSPNETQRLQSFRTGADRRRPPRCRAAGLEPLAAGARPGAHNPTGAPTAPGMSRDRSSGRQFSRPNRRRTR